MIVFHDADLRVHHTVHVHEARWRAWLTTECREAWVEVERYVPHLEIKLDRHPDTGAVRAWHAKPGAEPVEVAVRRTAVPAKTGP